MKSIIAIAAAALLASGCIRVIVPKQCSEKNTLKGGHGLEPGDRVISRWKNGFFAGTVLTVEGKVVKLAWDIPPPQYSWLPRAWIRRADERGKNLKPGTWAVCSKGAQRGLCRVEQVHGKKLTVTWVRTGVRQKIAVEDVLKVPDGLVEWAARRGKAIIKKIELAREINPKTPVTAGNKVAKGQTVLARWRDGNWWEARVTEITEAKITAAWLDGSRPLKLNPRDVAPIPKKGMTYKVGDLAFCKWSRTTRWWPARVDAVESNAVRITYADGEKGTVVPTLCVLGKK